MTTVNNLYEFMEEHGTPEWQENHNNSEKYWKEYHKVGGFPVPRSTHYDRKKEEV